MSLEEIEKAVMSLTPDEQNRFARWVYEHEVELKGGDEYISPQVQAKIRERAEVARTSPELLEDWDTASAKLRQHRDELRHKTGEPGRVKFRISQKQQCPLGLSLDACRIYRRELRSSHGRS